MLWDTGIFGEVERLRREMNNLFSNYNHTAGTTTFPLINVYDDKDKIVVSAELPGITKDKVNITFADGILILSGKQEPIENVNKMTVIRKERSEGYFEKTLRLPTKIDQNNINASFTNGILTVTLPKDESAKPKSISIES